MWVGIAILTEMRFSASLIVVCTKRTGLTDGTNNANQLCLALSGDEFQTRFHVLRCANELEPQKCTVACSNDGPVSA